MWFYHFNDKNKKKHYLCAFIKKNIIELIQKYREIERPIWFMLFVIFCISILDSSVFLILNIYLAKLGYNDPTIASFLSCRFLMAFMSAIPMGMLIQSRRIKPFYGFVVIGYFSAIFALLNIVEWASLWMIYLAFAFQGISIAGRFIITAPYIIRNVKKEQHTSVFSLAFATGSAGLIIGGGLVYLLSSLNPVYFHEGQILEYFCGFGILALLSVFQMKKDEFVPKIEGKRSDLKQFDWSLIVRAGMPNLLIAIGAGLTIPFVNLFFFHVFGMESGQFALLGTMTSILVLLGALLVPSIKGRWGYGSITVTQTLSVCALFLLATSDFISYWEGAIYVAIVCYVVRQPLMNLAGPMTAEMTMYYVGGRNREIMSAVNSSIWAGSWFFSSIIFKVLRESGLNYGSIFYITTALYIVGVALYFFLVKDFYQKEKDGLLVE